MITSSLSIISSLIPSTTYFTSSWSALAGAEIITLRAPAATCFSAESLSVNLPVDSITTSIFSFPQFTPPASGSEKTCIFLPLTIRKSAPATTSPGKFPWTESYLSRWARVTGSVRSLMATTDMFFFFNNALKVIRPMRPNPLIASLIFAMIEFFISRQTYMN
jgi:hypothetical protein